MTYTDGEGTHGDGVWTGQAILRGHEREVPRPVPLTVAAAPPRGRERQRFLVEKLAEIGVGELLWLAAERAEGRPPPVAKAGTWAVGALEQSGGAHLMAVEGPCDWPDLRRPLAVASPGNSAGIPAGVATVAIGPEGGFSATEIPEDTSPFGLGPRILRVETAAVVAAALLLLPDTGGAH